MARRLDFVGLGLQGAEAAFEGFAVEAVVAGLALLAFDDQAGFFEAAGVMAEQGQGDLDGVGDVFAGALFSVPEVFHDL